jgi:subtilisin family serine protease
MKINAVLLLLALLRVRSEPDGKDGAEVQAPEARDDGASQMKQRPNLRQEQSARELVVSSSRVLIKYSNEQGKLDALDLSTRVYHDFDEGNILAVEVDEAHLAELYNNSDIDSIEEDRFFYEQGFHERDLTEDEHEVRRLQQQVTPYGISMVQADQMVVGPYPVKVCIADTGVARRHPDLQQCSLSGANRYSNINGSPLYWRVDVRGHGTHVTGTVTAKSNNIGVRGIGNIPVYMTRALDDSGGARESDIYAAVQQCANSGASMQNLLTNLHDSRGFLLVAASGNNGANGVSWPGAHPRVIAVGAVQEDKTLWPGSNYGSQLELTAPGKMILSTTVNSVGQYVSR